VSPRRAIWVFGTVDAGGPCLPALLTFMLVWVRRPVFQSPVA
jgi:hypothetical protein